MARSPSRRRCGSISSPRRSAGVALTYAELLERLGYSFSRPKMRALCAILGDRRSRRREARGEPELAVLVVRQSDGIPGQGWWVAGGARSRGYAGPWEGPEARRFIAAVQARNLRLVEVPRRDRAGAPARINHIRSPILPG